MITSDSVEKACSEVSAYSDDRMTTEFDRFFQSQPALCDFIVQLTSESSPEIQELSLFLSYMVFKAVELDSSGAVGPVDSEIIEEAYQESENWIDRMSRVNADAVEGLLRDLHSESEPHLLRYVTSELNQPTANGSPLADEEKGEVFFVLKTVISSLMARDKRRRIASEAEK